MTSEDNNHHINYFICEAIRNANNLAQTLATRNGCDVAPTRAVGIVETPIYQAENGKLSFHDLTEEIYTVPVTISVAAIEAKAVDGFFKLYSKESPLKQAASTQQSQLAEMSMFLQDAELEKIIINLTEQPTYCWERYYCCKELMHAYLHSSETATYSLPMVRNVMLTLINSKGQNNIKDAQSMTDIAAYYGAIEMMMPRFYMPLLLKIFNEICENHGESTAYERIARKLRMPKSYVEYRLAYNDEFESYYLQIDNMSSQHE